jgi:hypothetical protein
MPDSHFPDMIDVIKRMPGGLPSVQRRLHGSGSDAPSTFRIQRASTSNRPILIVEDEHIIAADLDMQIRQDGGRPPRLALSIDAARDELETAGAELGGVILDVNVGGDTSFELADALVLAGLPFVFFTGYRAISIPDRFVAVPRVVKPASWNEIKNALDVARGRIARTGLGSFRDSVEAALPELRNRARRLSGNPEEADKLVERTLENAISAVGERSLRVTIKEWLMSLLDKTSSTGGGSRLH